MWNMGGGNPINLHWMKNQAIYSLHKYRNFRGGIFYPEISKQPPKTNQNTLANPLQHPGIMAAVFGQILLKFS